MPEQIESFRNQRDLKILSFKVGYILQQNRLKKYRQKTVMKFVVGKTFPNTDEK